jgi:hypothetical protein
VPNEQPAGTEHAREFPDYSGVIRRVGKEAEGSKEIQNRVEPIAPPVRKLAHVGPRVAQVPASATLPGGRQQLPRIVHAVDIVARFSEQVRVSTLAAWDIENAGTDGQGEKIDQASYLASVTFRSKERFVLEQVVGVERCFPPLRALSQKNTGSR